MVDAQVNSPSKGDGDDKPNTKQSTSLQDRFTALSHLASLTPPKKEGRSGNTSADLKNRSTHLNDTVMERHEQVGLELRLDHHSTSQDVIDKALQRRKGLQDPVLESVCLPGVRSSGSHKLNPLASPFDVAPTKVKDHSTSVAPDIHTNTLRLGPTRTSSRRTSKENLASASAFLSHFNLGKLIEVVEATKEEDKRSIKSSVDEGKLAKNPTEVGVTYKTPDIKTEDMGDGQSFQFVPEVGERGEIEFKDNYIKLKPLIGTLSLETATGKTLPNPTLAGHAVKFDNRGFSQLPDAVLSRYPRMAKYLTVVASQEGSTRLAVSNTSVPFVATILPTVDEGKATFKKEKSASLVLQPTSISMPTVVKETELCPKGQILSVPQDVSPETGNTMPGCLPVTPIFGATFLSRIERSHEVSAEKDAVQPRQMPFTVSQERSTEVAIPARELKETAILPSQGKILEQPPSTRLTLPERYAIPVRDQCSEATTPKSSAGVGGGGRRDEKSPQQMGKDPLMEQLSMVDERFSRDSKGIFARHDSPLSRCSSMSSDASLTFSITPDNLTASAQASICVNQTKTEDSDRFRRSIGPSPSPHRGQEVGFPVATAGNMGSISFGYSGKDEKQAADQKHIAGNWLDRFSNSTKNGNLLPRGQPSVLARMHGGICDDEGDSDGVAPGEWVKPVELLKGPTKAKVDNIDQFGLPLLQDPLDPLSRPVKGSSTGSTHRIQCSKAPGQLRYPHSKLPHSRILQDGTSFNCSTPGAMQPYGRVGNAEAGATVKVKKKDIAIMGWHEGGTTRIGKLDEKAREDLRRPFIEDDWQRKDECEQEKIKWRVPREGGLFASPPGSAHGASALLAQNKPHIVSSRGSGRGSGRVSGSMLSHPTQKGGLKTGVNNTVPNVKGSTARISQSITDQIPSASGTPMALHRFNTQMAPPAPSATSGKIAQVKQPLVAAYVRKLCPLFFIGLCHRGQNCLDLHPNYDKQSGIHEDKRFATKEGFNEEALMSTKVVKDKDKALEGLTGEPKDDADKRCHGTQPDVNIRPGRPRPLTLQVGSVTVSRNARGETEWTVEPPKKPEHVEEESMAEPGITKPKKQGKRRVQE